MMQYRIGYDVRELIYNEEPSDAEMLEYLTMLGELDVIPREVVISVA